MSVARWEIGGLLSPLRGLAGGRGGWTALRKNRPLVLRSNSRTTFFHHRIGFFVVLVDAGQLFRCVGVLLNDAHSILHPLVCDLSRYNLRLPISFLRDLSTSKRRSPTFLCPMLRSPQVVVVHKTLHRPSLSARSRQFASAGGHGLK